MKNSGKDKEFDVEEYIENLAEAFKRVLELVFNAEVKHTDIKYYDICDVSEFPLNIAIIEYYVVHRKHGEEETIKCVITPMRIEFFFD